MAAVPATITVSFTSNYAGPHRVCYRINNSGTYTCATVICAGGGGVCSYDVGVTVDNETCANVIFDGYVQASCQDISSEIDRIPFLSTFTPTPSCSKYTVTCNYSGVGTVVMVDGGTGYNPLSPPSVSFTGDGTGAMANANVGTGFITTETITFSNSGVGYTNGIYANVPLLGGSGTGAQGTFSVSGGVILSGSVTTPGNGYTTGNVLSPDPAFMGPSAPTVTATFAITSNLGIVLSITVTASGTNYTTPPTVNIAPSGVTNATATSTLTTCDGFTSYGCDPLSTPVDYSGFLTPGDSVEICSSSPAFDVPGAQYSTVASGNCLCACQTYSFEALQKNVTYAYIYTACDGAVVSGTLSDSSSPSMITFCAVTDSLIYVASDPLANPPAIGLLGTC